MEKVYPSYYKDFECIADACPDSCCAGWEIMIDPKSMKRYKNYKGTFGKRIRKSINYRRQSFHQNDRRCAFLNDENLCDMITACGEDMLCQTCKRYPRHVEVFDNMREFSIGLSCPVACELILTQDKLTLITRENEKEDEADEEFDELLFSQLLDARNELFDIAENDNLTIHERMVLLLALGHRIQRRVSSYELFGMEEIYPVFKELEGVSHILEKSISQADEAPAAKIMEELFSMLHKMEVLRAEWTHFLNHCENVLFTGGDEEYLDMLSFEVSEKILQQILTYFLYTYFTGAVYDGNPYVKIKFAVVSTLYIEMMLKVMVWENDGLSMEDYIEAAHNYAREIEHSDLNVEHMEKLIAKEDCFRIQKLLKVISAEI